MKERSYFFFLNAHATYKRKVQRGAVDLYMKENDIFAMFSEGCIKSVLHYSLSSIYYKHMK